MPAQKLPVVEWNFSGVEPSLVSYAFFYEYARQSEKIKDLVNVYRSMLPYKVDYNLEHGWLFSSEKLDSLSEKERDDLWQCTEKFKANDYLTVIEWLSRCEPFPETPFSKLNREDYLRNPDSYFMRGDIPVDGYGIGDIGYCWMKDFDLNSDSLRVNLGVGASLPLDASESLGNHVTVHMLRIDWWKTDNELKDDFAELLSIYRKHIGVDCVKPSGRGLLNRPLDLPKECKKKSTALAHLGKLRCLESAGSWENYLSLYHHHADSTNRRYHEKDVSAARSVLAWLEDQV